MHFYSLESKNLLIDRKDYTDKNYVNAFVRLFIYRAFSALILVLLYM